MLRSRFERAALRLPVGVPLALAATVVACDAWAFRCDGWLIEAGISQFEVSQRCGEPAASERRSEWRPVTTFQQQCQVFNEPVPVPPGEMRSGHAPPPRYRPRTVCTNIPITITVPVDVDVWYYDDVSVPKALHFENGRLFWVEPLWKLRHRS